MTFRLPVGINPFNWTANLQLGLASLEGELEAGTHRETEGGTQGVLGGVLQEVPKGCFKHPLQALKSVS